AGDPPPPHSFPTRRSSDLTHSSIRLQVDRMIHPWIPSFFFSCSMAAAAFFFVKENNARISTEALLWSMPSIQILILGSSVNFCYHHSISLLKCKNYFK